MVRKQKTSGRKSFSAETKAEAMRLIHEEGYTTKQAATQIGCSINAIQNWKAAAKTAGRAAKPAKKARKIKRRRRKDVAKTTVGTVSVTKPPVTFDKFVQAYWNESPEATDILRLPPDLMPAAVQYVNNVLRYAYDRFCG